MSQQPTNCHDAVLARLDAIILALGGGAVYQPQHHAGTPTGAIAARWGWDLAIDVSAHRLYYAAAAQSSAWSLLSPSPAPAPAPSPTPSPSPSPSPTTLTTAIANPSFELPVLVSSVFAYSVAGWSSSSWLNLGVQWLGPATGLTAPDGNQVLFVQGGQWAAQAIAGLTLTAGTYTLKVWALSRADWAATGYGVKLLAGATEIISQSGALTPGAAVEVTGSVTVPSGHPDLGQPLTIRLEAVGLQTSFDDVRLWVPA